MVDIQWLARVAAGALLVGVWACGSRPEPPPSCDVSSCPRGCCDADGRCQSATEQACGILGDTCQVCEAGQGCVQGACVSRPDAGRDDGGGPLDAGGGADSGTVVDGGAADAGLDAGVDAGVDGGGDAGAFDAGTAPDAGADLDAGAPDAGAATDGGAPDGGLLVRIGSPCTSYTDCLGLGASAFCKTETLPWPGTPPTPYPRGFCTIRCATSACPSGSVCAGGPSTYPYLFNETDRFCTAACASTCPLANFQCMPVTTLTNTLRQNGCFMRLGSANPTPPPFTGGGAPTKAGGPCVTPSDCASPPDPFLAVCLTEASGFPGGLCLADSELAPPDAWCAQGGGAELSFPLLDGGTSYFCNGTCPNPGLGRVVGRAGYSCLKLTRPDGGLAGVPWPSCTDAASCGGGVTSCDPATGYCCTDAGQCADSY